MSLLQFASQSRLLLIGALIVLTGCRPGHEQGAAPQSAAAPAPAPAAAPEHAATMFTVAQLNEREINRRGVETVIWAMPAVNYDLMRQEMIDATEGEVGQVIFWGKPLSWHNQTLTPNPDTLYFMGFFDLKNSGPMVIEIPPADSGAVNCNIVTAWQMPLEDVGKLGIDKGAGGKFLILPPGSDKPAPKGFIALHSDTYGGFFLCRSNLASHADADVEASMKYGKRIKFFPLSELGSPRESTVYVDVMNTDFDATIPYDAHFFEALNRVVQAEPWIERDRAMIDSLKTLGIEKGKPFNPDAATRKLLDEAAQEAHAVLEARYEAGWGNFFPGTQWRAAAPDEFIRAASNGYNDPNVYPVDARGTTYTYGYVGIKRLGAGQFYLMTIKDKGGAALEGGKNYRLRVPPNVPVQQYWSVTVYDRQTHALVRDVPRVSRASNVTEVVRGDDGSVDIFLGPAAPAGKEANWIPTDPNRPFELMFRFYGPTQALFDKSWTLPDVERMQ